MKGKTPRINFVNDPVPGIDQIPITETHPFLEAYDKRTDSAYLIYEQVYASHVRRDGLCTREFILQETNHAQQIILEGYETSQQALDVLQARRGKHVELIIFGDKVTRIGRGVSESDIDRA